jgi:hypothetical protein
VEGELVGYVASAPGLVAVGSSGPKHHSAYYRLFAAARWSLDALGLALFHLIVPLLAPGPVPLTLDDTLARKRGLKVFGAGMHHDPLARSTPDRQRALPLSTAISSR